MDLDRSALQQIVFTAFVAAAVDGFIDDDEITAINGFAQNHWKMEWGPLQTFLRDVDDHVVEFYQTLGEEDLEERLFNQILPQLNLGSKSLLLELLTNLMQADQEIEQAEVRILERLKKSL
ncbi:MAG: hypothetical protein A2557_07365 [Candidatus Lambdaproteobacteria bacterium RIFOXYD2_FULL_56_26]|uniref:Co-chaperone DjlA N-terminal domain-containing protein n=1 Tax=Candidatus Lambdaproteobacteria bacterium RIFOXYD2_FULL_56_26 TaxID=1817773 RepID=A0A1F6H329_9PROT|nr:MAG: hypothetical protein A2557_07365 [Candidatus Lambdaproteobacteria bacterium RIFOXYD2_FULL_56_26]